MQINPIPQPHLLPLTTHHSPFPTLRSPLTSHLSPLTPHHSPLPTLPSLTPQSSPHPPAQPHHA
jgi:hypothetical protein